MILTELPVTTSPCCNKPDATSTKGALKTKLPLRGSDCSKICWPAIWLPTMISLSCNAGSVLVLPSKPTSLRSR